MSADTRAAFLRLRIQLSKEDVNSALRSIRALEHGYDDLEDSEQAFVQASKEATKAMRGEAKAASDLSKRYQDVKRSAEQARNRTLQTVGSTGRLTSEVRGIAGAAGFGGAGQAIGVGADVIELTESLPRLKEAFKGIPAAFQQLASELGTTPGRLLALGGALAVLGVGLDLLKKQAEATKQAAATAIEGALSYFDIINTKNREEVDELLKAANLEKTIREQRFKAVSDLLFQMQDEIDKYGEVTAATIRLGEFLGINAGELSAASEAFDKELIALDASQAAVLALEAAQRDAEVAARTLAETERKLAEERQKAQDQFVNTSISTLNAALGMSGDQAKERLKNIQNEIAAIERFNTIAGQSQENIDANNIRLENLKDEYQILSDLIPTVIALNDQLAYEIKQREDTIKAVEKFNEEYKRVEMAAAEARLAATERYQDTLISIAERSAEAAADALRDLEAERAKLALELSRDDQDAQLQLERDRQDALIDFQREEEKAARDHLNTLKRIQREGRRDAVQAIQDRDAVALNAAVLARKQALEDEQESYDQEREDRAIAYKHLLEDQQKQFNRERADRLTKYQRDLADAQAAYTAEINLANQKRNAELVAARNQYDQELQMIALKTAQQLTALNTGIQQELALINMGWQARLALDAAYQQKLLAQAAALQGLQPAYAGKLPTSPGFKGSNPYLTPPQLASGGYIQREGLAYLHAGETVIPAKGRGGDMTLNVNLNGATMKSVVAASKQQALEVVGIALDELGAA